MPQPALRTYAQDATTWREYQPFLPPAWRLTDTDTGTGTGDGAPGRIPREEYLRWRGLQVHLDRLDAPADAEGRPNPVVIVCHGGGGYGRMLAPVGVALKDAGYDVVLPDLPGYGLTTVPSKAMRYPLWVDLVTHLATTERERTGRPVALLGMSMGGMLTYHAAAQAPPDTVAAILVTTLMDPREAATRVAVGRLPGGARLVPLLRAAGGVRLPMPWLAKLSAMSSRPEINALCARDRQGGGVRAPLAFLHSWMTYVPAQEPEDFDRAPVLLMHPGNDRWTPAALSRSVYDRLTTPKRYATLESCEHFPIESPGVETLRTESLAFLSAHLGPPSR